MVEREIMEECSAKLKINGFAKMEDIVEGTDGTLVELKNVPNSNDFSVKTKEPQLLTLYNVFKQVYHKRLSAIDDASGGECEAKFEEKFKVLLAYVEQLEEQYEILISTMMELEKEAEQRVVQMEKRLKSSAKSTMESVLNLHKYEQEMRKMVNERLHLESVIDNMQQNCLILQEENSFLRDQNFNLKHDIHALLHIVQHARTTGHWELDCVTFCEVTPEQVFGPVQSMSQMYSPGSTCTNDTKIERNEKSHIASNCSSGSPLSSSSNLSIQPGEVESFDAVNSLHFFKNDVHNELLKKDKTISFLQSQLSDIKHKLTLKEAECQCQLWEIETLREQRKCLPFDKDEDEEALPEEDVLDVQHLCNSPLQKSISLPIIENNNLCSNKQKLFSAKSHPLCSRKKNVFLPKQEYLEQLRQRIMKAKDKKQSCRPVIRKSDYMSCFPRAYSEPHLFMYGNRIYVYRPCEPLHKGSSFALNEDFHDSLHPCQSIDLKLPSDDHISDVTRPCDWSLVHNSNCHAVHEHMLPYNKVNVSISSCTTSESEDLPHIQGQDNLCNVCLPSICSNSHSCGNHKHKNNCVLQANGTNGSDYTVESKLHNITDTSDTGVQTVIIKCNSIALQADITDENSNSIKDVLSINGCTGMNAAEVNKNMQCLKESLLKAEDKALAKEILIEQLQSHLITIVKEVELKDKALENVEKKLDSSRKECASMKNEIANFENKIQCLLKELDDAKVLHDNLKLKVEAGQEHIEELREQAKTLQDQKRSLMTQLDVQGDDLEATKNELKISESKLQKATLQIEQQSQIIKSLQDALVQTKRIIDETRLSNHKTVPLPHGRSISQSTSTNSSRSSIVDI